MNATLVAASADPLNSSTQVMRPVPASTLTSNTQRGRRAPQARMAPAVPTATRPMPAKTSRFALSAQPGMSGASRTVMPPKK